MCCRDLAKGCCSGLFTLLVSAGFFILFYWAVFQPHQIRSTVGSATLTNLTVSNNATAISYRLAVSFSLYNPSRRVDIYYDTLDAELRYRGVFLGAANGTSTSPTEFYQRRKTGDTVKVEFEGSGVGVSGDVAGELEKEMGQGAVRLEVAMDARVRYRFDKIKIRQKPEIWCSLTIPVKPEGRGVGGALESGDRCSVGY